MENSNSLSLPPALYPNLEELGDYMGLSLNSDEVQRNLALVPVASNVSGWHWTHLFVFRVQFLLSIATHKELFHICKQWHFRVSDLSLAVLLLFPGLVCSTVCFSISATIALYNIFSVKAAKSNCVSFKKEEVVVYVC